MSRVDIAAGNCRIKERGCCSSKGIYTGDPLYHRINSNPRHSLSAEEGTETARTGAEGEVLQNFSTFPNYPGFSEITRGTFPESGWNKQEICNPPISGRPGKFGKVIGTL